MNLTELKPGRTGRGNIDKVKAQHPCFGARRNRARIHLPVCPACNIECGFCRRSLNGNENRPGVASAILTPGEAARRVNAALKVCEELSVVGVAGPGDSLVGDAMFESLRSVGRAHPQLLKCISTNGLLLEERADELIELGIDTLTVTVNAVEPDILARIVLRVRYGGVRYEGSEGARILIENQLAGIRRMAEAGTVIKVNSVLIPGINDAHIPEVARTAAAAGASLYNIIPLIPQYVFADFNEPTCAEIDAARGEAERYIEVFRHCQHCRADAVGVPGVSDYAAGIFRERAEEVFSHG
jgi:nitrogen fixation protein NifB